MIRVIIKHPLRLIVFASLLLGAQVIFADTSASDSHVAIRFFLVSGSHKTETSTRFPGDIIVVRVEGLSPMTQYILRASMPGNGGEYRSFIEVQSDASGVIETDTAIPSAGTYKKADPDGLFWSMINFSSDVTLSPGIHFSVENENATLRTATLEMKYLKPGVQKVDLTGTGLVGTLYLPPVEMGARPAIITYGGSEGGTSSGTFYAAALANRGFVALGLGYFGAPGLPSQLAGVSLEYFQSAIRYLKSRPDVVASKIGVMGPSRGGELSLLLGATFSEIKAVVAQVPSPYRWAGNVEGGPVPAWTLRGLGLPFLNVTGELVPKVLPDGRTVYSNTPAFLAAFKQADIKTLDMVTSRVEKTNGPVLLLGGDDDQVWPSCLFARRAIERLKNKKHAFNDEFICYGKAGHGVTGIPGAPTTEVATFHPTMKIWLSMGGTPEGNAAGQRASWTKTLQFLNKSLK